MATYLAPTARSVVPGRLLRTWLRILVREVMLMHQSRGTDPDWALAGGFSRAGDVLDGGERQRETEGRTFPRDAAALDPDAPAHRLNEDAAEVQPHPRA